MMPLPGHPYTWHTAKCLEVPTGTRLPAELTFSWDSQHRGLLTANNHSAGSENVLPFTVSNTALPPLAWNAEPFGMAVPPEHFSIWVLDSDSCGWNSWAILLKALDLNLVLLHQAIGHHSSPSAALCPSSKNEWSAIMRLLCITIWDASPSTSASEFNPNLLFGFSLGFSFGKPIAKCQLQCHFWHP